ncbi:LacI family DNA-binding transcriptional regulator [Phytoactinopolyspora endophytica]|uniref:LacI family DNA-binding transcriptional regulator n=1 Tax=Phytoactinopolyspora endophytica TaxID=1642495 RepID=UPI00101DD828|nr:LacI family DNA-binding transcriptional regulator [Phytoactinopolyspora endophytica]
MPPKRQRPTLRDVATRVGVSETAASFALNGKPGVSEETRRRILEVAEELQWTPNHAAQILSGARSSMTIGLAVARSVQDVGSELFFLRLISGMHTVLSGHRYGLLFQVVESVEEELELYRRWANEKRVDGIILVDLRIDDPRPRAVAELDIPSIVAGGPDPAGTIPSVSIDDTAAMQTVMQYLSTRGHHRVAYVSGSASLLHVHRRAEAFSQAGRDYGLEAADVLQTDFSAAASARATQRLLATNGRPTAVIYDNEVLAVAGMREIQAAGLQIPADVAVVTCEDTPICGVVQPALTALYRDTWNFGADVAGHLLNLIEGNPDTGAVEQVPELVVRDST